MTAHAPTILATSIGFNARRRGDYDWDPGPIFDFAADLAVSPDLPRICLVGTAGGDGPCTGVSSPTAHSRWATPPTTVGL